MNVIRGSLGYTNLLSRSHLGGIPRWLQGRWKLYLLAPSPRLDLQLDYRAINLKTQCGLADLNYNNQGSQKQLRRDW